MHFQQIPNSWEGGGGLDRQKKKKNSQFAIISQPRGGRGGLESLGWFPKFNRLLVLIASLSPAA